MKLGDLKPIARNGELYILIAKDEEAEEDLMLEAYLYNQLTKRLSDAISLQQMFKFGTFEAVAEDADFR